MTLSVLKAVSRQHLYQLRREVRDADELLTFEESQTIQIAIDLVEKLIEGVERASAPQDEAPLPPPRPQGAPERRPLDSEDQPTLHIVP